MSDQPSDPTPSDGASGPAQIRAKAARGFAWSGGQAVFGRVLSLVGFVVLARLLTPHEYGVVAVANVFAVLLGIFAAGGMSAALVQLPKVDKKDLDTLFCVGLALSLVLALLQALAAWPLAAAFHEPELRPVLQVLAVCFPFVAMGAVHQAVLQRRLEFRRLALRTMLADAIATVAGVIFAVAGLGVWALVVQTVAAIVLGSLGVIFQSGYRPSLYVSWERFRPLFASTRQFVAGALTVFLNERSDDFLIGSVIGTRALGIYTIAYRVLTVMLDVLTLSMRQVAFPVFSRLQLDRERLLRAYRSAIAMCATLAFPSFTFALVAAPEIVHVVFGSKWDASVPIMRILALFGLCEAITMVDTALLQAVGRAAFVFRIAVLGTVVQVAAFAAAVNFGIEWVAAAFVIRAYLMAPISLIAAAHALRTRTWHTVSGAVAPASSAAVMAVTVLGAKALLGDGLALGARLVIIAAVAALSYVAALRLLSPETFDEALDYLRNALGRGDEAVVAATGS